ncbi:MAG: DUF4956 domain-containing protein [Chloroflexaceae bacterium]|jgi:hypothetical protein|nr:DUF4956 domain-containing protein [Chloroflexaceae bacterium]
MTTEITAFHVGSFLIHFAANLVALAIVAYALYFRRHSRRDLLMAYATINVGLFLVMTIFSLYDAGIGIGFGLFAILSIIRIRSEEFSTTELSYVFSILAIALINSFGIDPQIPSVVEILFLVLLNAIAILVIYFMDHPHFLRTVGRQQITLDTIHSNEHDLRADLERRLNVRVLDYAIAHVDYVREITVLNVRYANEAQA